MKLLIKQRVFSWRDTYDIYDGQGNVRYFVKAGAFTLGHQIHVYDTSQNELAVIRERLLAFMPVFEIEIGSRKVGTIRKKFTFFRPKYEVDYNGWRIEGDFLSWDYDVYNGQGGAIMHISKELLHWGDTYSIDIADPADELLGILLVIAIDAANCGRAALSLPMD